MDHMIKEKFIVTDGKIVTDEIYRVTGLDVEMDQVIKNISSEESNIYFFDKDLSGRSENEKDVSLAWLDTGIKTNRNEPMMISLLKWSDYFSGYYVGTPSYLVNGMCRRTPHSERKLRSNLLKFCNRYRKDHADRICKIEPEVKDRCEICDEKPIFIKNEEALSNVTEAIYDRLLFPNWKSMKGLDRYIKIIGTRIMQLVSAERTEYFVANKTKSVIVNTGMMDLFGNDFLVLYRYFEKYKTYIAECVIESKQDYLSYGFTREQSMIQIEPVSFFEEKEEVFNPNKEDFDINQNCLIHIIQERRDRFPESIRSQSDNKIAGQIMNALERGIKMQRRDRSFAKASYSGKSGTVSWFMPLHIDAPLREEPELVMVVRKAGDFYEIKTILPYDDDLKDRITALSLYSKIW